MIGSPDFWAFVGITAGIYTIFGLGLQLQLGFAGLLNFGYVAFMAVSAYTMAILTVKESLPLWAASLAGVATAAVFGIGEQFLPCAAAGHDDRVVAFAGFGERFVSELLHAALVFLPRRGSRTGGLPDRLGVLHWRKFRVPI